MVGAPDSQGSVALLVIVIDVTDFGDFSRSSAEFGELAHDV